MTPGGSFSAGKSQRAQALFVSNFAVPSTHLQLDLSTLKKRLGVVAHGSGASVARGAKASKDYPLRVYSWVYHGIPTIPAMTNKELS